MYISGDEETYNKLKAQKEVAECKVGCPLVWHEAPSDRCVYIRRSGDIDNREQWAEMIEWLYTRALRLHDSLVPFLMEAQEQG